MPSRRIAAALAIPRETATEHVRHAIQGLLNFMEFGAPNEEARKDVRATLHRLWLALRELEQDNV